MIVKFVFLSSLYNFNNCISLNHHVQTEIKLANDNSSLVTCKGRNLFFPLLIIVEYDNQSHVSHTGENVYLYSIICLQLASNITYVLFNKLTTACRCCSIINTASGLTPL